MGRGENVTLVNKRASTKLPRPVGIATNSHHGSLQYEKLGTNLGLMSEKNILKKFTMNG